MQPGNFREFVGILLDIINVLVVFVFALSFLAILWGVTSAWIIGGGNEIEIARGKKIVLVGVIVLVIMTGIWGILELLRYSLFGI